MKKKVVRILGEGGQTQEEAAEEKARRVTDGVEKEL